MGRGVREEGCTKDREAEEGEKREVADTKRLG